MEIKRTLEVGILSGENLKDVKHLSKMKTYVAAWIDPYVKYTTPPDEKGGVNPIWNEKFTFIVPEGVMQQATSYLTIEILSKSLTGDRTVGEVRIPLPEILKLGSGRSNELHFATYQVHRPSGRAQGALRLSFRWSNKFQVESMAEKLAGAAAATYNTPNQGSTNLPNLGSYGDREVVEQQQFHSYLPEGTLVPPSGKTIPQTYKKSASISPSLPVPAPPRTSPPTAPPKASPPPPPPSSNAYLPAPALMPPTKIVPAVPRGKIYRAPAFSPKQPPSKDSYIAAPPEENSTPKGRPAGERSGGEVFKGQLGQVLLKDVIG